MKKFFSLILAIALMGSAQAALRLEYFNEDGDAITVTQDTTIEISWYEDDGIEVTMTLEGTIASDESKDFDAFLTRSEENIIDQLCLNQCIPGNGQLTQEMNFPALPGMTTEAWYAHYYPIQEGTVTIAYKFSDRVNPAITLTVKYIYGESTATEQVTIDKKYQGIFTVLGQKVAATSIDELPQGIYIVNGKKVIKY